MRKAIVTCLAALMLLSSTPCAAFAKDGKDSWRKEEIVARLKKARAERRRVTLKFKDGASVTGRVGELREQGLTFEPDGLGPELRRQNAAAVILYQNVASVEHPSKVKNFLKKVGYGLALGGAYAVVMPLNGIAILLGGSSIPGCP